MKKEKNSQTQEAIEEAEDCTLLNSSSIDPSAKSKKTSVSDISSSTRFGIVTLVLAIMGIIVSIDSLVKVKEWNSGLKTIKDKIESHIEIEQNRLNNLEASLQHINARQQSFEQQLSEYHSTLSALAPLLEKRSPEEASTDVVWQLEKAYDWLQEAQLDLRWSNDWQGALVLLKSANAVIAQMRVPDLGIVQSLLEKNISDLSAIQPVDEVLLLGKIKVMMNSVNTLPSPAATSSNNVSKTKSNTETGWRSVLNRGFEWIQEVVVVKPVDSSVTTHPFHSRRVLNENLVIALQQAQWALLKKDNVLFHWSLEQISQMIHNGDTLIDLNNEQTEMFLQNLGFLEKQNLMPPALPDLQPACQQLKAYMDTLNGHLSEKVKA